MMGFRVLLMAFTFSKQNARVKLARNNKIAIKVMAMVSRRDWLD